MRFFEGYRDNPNPTTGAVQQYLIHSEEKLNADTNEWEIIQICFEINYNTGQWRKLRRNVTVRQTAQLRLAHYVHLLFVQAAHCTLTH